MMKYPDILKDSTTSTGTGPITVAGLAAVGFQAFPAGMSVGDQFGYKIGDPGVPEWEAGIGTLTASMVFSRSPTSSSNGGALVNFSSGTKTVIATAVGALLAKFMSTGTATFSTTVPLSALGDTFMPPQTVSSVLAFTAGANPAQGARVYVRLTADGTNAPTFTGFKEWGGSLGYDNRNGIVNQVQFFYDGVDFWYSVSQAVGATPVAAPDTTAPTLSSPTSAATGATTGSGSVTTNEGNGTLYYLATSNSTETAATVKASGATLAISSTGSKAVTVSGLTASTAYYLHFLHRDTAGNDSTVASSASFTTQAAGAPADTTPPTHSGAVSTSNITSSGYTMSWPAATDDVGVTGYETSTDGGSTWSDAGNVSSRTITGAAASTTYQLRARAYDAAGNRSTAIPGSVTTAASGVAEEDGRLTALTAGMAEEGMAEEGTSAPYSYYPTATNTWTSPNGGMATKALQSDVDGYISISPTVATTGCEAMLFFKSTNTLGALSSWEYAVFIRGGNTYHIYRNNTATNATVQIQRQVGDIVRLRRAGFNMIVEVARAATPTTFTEIYRWTGVSTGVLYAGLAVNGTANTTARFTAIKYSGLA